MRRQLLAIAMALPPVVASVAAAQTVQPADPPADVLLLIQSELTHLKKAEQRISLQVSDASPGQTLERIREAVRFDIAVEGELSRTPKLTATFRDAPAREVLAWFAKEVDVVYRAEGGRRLVVFPRRPSEQR